MNAAVILGAGGALAPKAPGRGLSTCVLVAPLVAPKEEKKNADRVSKAHVGPPHPEV